MTQRDDLEPIGGLGTAATKGGSVKSRRLGQICVGANTSAVSRFRLASQSGGWHLRVGVVRGQPLFEGAPSQEVADAMPGGKFPGPRSMFAEVVP